MPKFPGFIGPTYQDRSPRASLDRCVNWYPSRIETGLGANAFVYHATPGLSLFKDLANGGPIRGIGPWAAPYYVASKDHFFKVTGAGVVTDIGAIVDDADHTKVEMETNGGQIFLTSAGTPYLVDIGTAAFVAITGLTGNFRGAIFLDGYFITFEIGTQKFYISDLYDGANWDPLEFASAEAYPEGISAIIQDHGELWLFGDFSTEVWFDSGDADFPFRRIPGAVLPQACYAPASPQALDNSVFWFGSSVWRARGYQAERVSTHAMENAFQHYSRTDDAIGFQYKEEGHWFYELLFPTADKSWAYDCATGLWHERSSLVGGVEHARIIRAVSFQTLLAGSRIDAKLYNQSTVYFDEAGTAITRTRQAPHLNEQKNWIYYHRLGVNVETGTGQLTITEGTFTSNPLTGVVSWAGVKVNYRGTAYTITNGNTTNAYIYWQVASPTVFATSAGAPTLGLNDILIGQNSGGVYSAKWDITQAMWSLSWSDDGGNTFSTPISKTGGARGDYLRLVRWHNLGRSRDRVFRLTFSSPTEASLVDAYIGMTAGTDARE